jgi:hypothetical protein
MKGKRMKKLFSISVVVFVNLQGMSDPDATVYKYRIYCVTEAQNVYAWNATPPTTCPNNTAHTINANSISIVDQRASNIVKIKQESTPTGGNFRAETFVLTAATGPGMTVMQKSWPINISTLQVSFTTDSSNQGDTVTVECPSNLPIGAITQNVTAGDTVINVSPSVITTVMLGYCIILSDGTNSDDLGKIIAIDSVNNTLTMDLASANNYTAATPTVVGLTIRPISYFQFGPPQTYNLGQSSLGASSIPANLPVTIKYQNNGTTQKTVVFAYEYLY